MTRIYELTHVDMKHHLIKKYYFNKYAHMKIFTFIRFRRKLKSSMYNNYKVYRNDTAIKWILY